MISERQKHDLCQMILVHMSSCKFHRISIQSQEVMFVSIKKSL